MHIRSEKLRNAYHYVKAANIVERINQVVKAPHDEGQLVEAPEEDEIDGIPHSSNNKDDTDVTIPTEHNTPKDPEFDTADIISGTGSGPSMENRRNYL